jgi:hypothetical protein
MKVQLRIEFKALSDPMGTDQIILDSFLKIIGRFGIAELRQAINDNVDLSILAQQYAGGLLNMARMFAKIMQVDKSQLNSPNVLILLQEKRPDLYRELVTHPRGRQWLEWNLDKFRKMI